MEIGNVLFLSEGNGAEQTAVRWGDKIGKMISEGLSWIKIKKDRTMIRIGDTLKRQNSTPADSRFEFMTDKNVVNTFCASSIGRAGVWAMDLFNGISQVMFND